MTPVTSILTVLNPEPESAAGLDSVVSYLREVTSHLLTCSATNWLAVEFIKSSNPSFSTFLKNCFNDLNIF
jgi:hypothetical protein